MQHIPQDPFLRKISCVALYTLDDTGGIVLGVLTGRTGRKDVQNAQDSIAYDMPRSPLGKPAEIAPSPAPSLMRAPRSTHSAAEHRQTDVKCREPPTEHFYSSREGG